MKPISFVSRDLDLWAFQHGVTLDFSQPGKPTDNAFAESFNGKVRAECLSTAWLLFLDDARRKCDTWRRDYNEERPHSAIGDKCPIDSRTVPGHMARPVPNHGGVPAKPGPTSGSKVKITKGLSLWLDEKRGSRQLPWSSWLMVPPAMKDQPD